MSNDVITPGPVVTTGPGTRPPRWLLLKTLVRKPLALVTGGFLLVIILASLAAPLIAPYQPTALDLPNAFSGPTAKHLLGADELGRDVLTRLLYGGLQIEIGVLEGILTVLGVAIPLGILSGYLGGIFDRVMSAITDAILAIPAIILVLVILSLFPNNSHVSMIGFGLLISPGIARIIRGVTLPLREADFVAAARISGVSELQIMARHILTAVLRTAIIQASFVAASALHFVVALGYLGLTASPGQPDWGQMVAVAATQITSHPWLLVPPGGLVALTVLALILFGNALRDSSANVNQVAAMAEPVLPVGPPTPVAPVKDAQLPAPDALLAVRDLSVVFSNRKNQTRIVDGVSFDVRPGETVGLMGESGAGKSITALAILRLLPGAARLTGGQVFFEGRDLVALNDREFDRLRGTTLGLVSQEPLSSLDPTFTVGSQLGELVRRHDRVSGPKLKARCLELLNQVQLPDPARVLKSYPHELSGGMAQRVALAMALAGRPRLLVADEPTTALDVTVQKEILALFRKVQQETGMAILLVTHNFGVVADICDRVFVMYAGQVFEDAGVYELFRRPLNPYSQGLLRANPAKAQPGQPLQVIPGRVPSPGNWPPGCRFAPRCPYAQPECTTRFIPLVETGQGRLSRCIRLGELVEKELL